MGPAPSSAATPPPPSKPANHMGFSGGPGAARLVPSSSASSSSSSPSLAAQARSTPPSKKHPPPSPPPGAASRAEMLVSPESMDSASAGGWSVRHTKMREVLGEASVDMQALQKLAWNGIPHNYRSSAWKIMLGFMPAQEQRREVVLSRLRKEYADQIATVFEGPRGDYEEKQKRQIIVDLPRTNPNIELFQDERVQLSLHRLLYIWAIRHPGTGYVQGMNDLATPFFVVFLCSELGIVYAPKTVEGVDEEVLQRVEADTYYCLSRLLDGVQDNFTFAQKGIQRKVFALKRLTRRVEPALCDFLDSINVDFLHFGYRWMNCLLMRELNLECVLRLWDAYISEGERFPQFHVYVCVAFLKSLKGSIMGQDFPFVMKKLQEVGTADWTARDIDVLLSEAYTWREQYGDAQSHLD